MVATVLVAGGACSLADGGTELTPTGPRAPVAPAPVDPAEALDALTSLPSVPRSPAGLPAYDRDAFGRAWDDVEGNGCNQRDDVLLRDAVPGTTVLGRQGACRHDVLAGTWIDPYTGRELVLDDLKDLRRAQAVQIDHVVPLAEAWRSGASQWSSARRRAFANDLDVLLAVDGPTNMSKGDDDPAAWRPRQSHQCAYAARWVVVKRDWGLAVDESERRALTEMLSTCRG
ncbi:hypothetical protein GCM10007231_18080 [Nocardioides daphniae]|uniref:GmrSD restriction endonucleases C-terminal domain-containing protein n=1 Tax=Nocardioides daphniae TaxID=402297 RepID=A0ABQ1QAW5_9ACTN|nr:hypothetical protein GCM10007231_18080 [Nocardioides daphniae]